jgi:hypothetical protein
MLAEESRIVGSAPKSPSQQERTLTRLTWQADGRQLPSRRARTTAAA